MDITFFLAGLIDIWEGITGLFDYVLLGMEA